MVERVETEKSNSVNYSFIDLVLLSLVHAMYIYIYIYIYIANEKWIGKFFIDNWTSNLNTKAYQLTEFQLTYNITCLVFQL
jgi:hypothetical protein